MLKKYDAVHLLGKEGYIEEIKNDVALVIFKDGPVWCWLEDLIKREVSNMFIAVVNFTTGYSSNNLYDFKCDDKTLKIGDHVVVDTVNGYSIGKIVDFKVKSSKATKWVVDKIDINKHEVRLEKEKRAAALKNKMDKRRKEIEDANIHLYLSTIDPEYAKMYNELNALGVQ